MRRNCRWERTEISARSIFLNEANWIADVCRAEFGRSWSRAPVSAPACELNALVLSDATLR